MPLLSTALAHYLRFFRLRPLLGAYHSSYPRPSSPQPGVGSAVENAPPLGSVSLCASNYGLRRQPPPSYPPSWSLPALHQQAAAADAADGRRSRGALRLPLQVPARDWSPGGRPEDACLPPGGRLAEHEAGQPLSCRACSVTQPSLAAARRAGWLAHHTRCGVVLTALASAVSLEQGCEHTQMDPSLPRSQTSERPGPLVCPRPMPAKFRTWQTHTMGPSLSSRARLLVGPLPCIAHRIGPSLLPAQAHHPPPLPRSYLCLWLPHLALEQRVPSLCPSYLCRRGRHSTYMPFHCRWGLRVIPSPPPA